MEGWLSTDGDCSFCGEKNWNGEWHGPGGRVLCCRACALRILPALLADTIFAQALAFHMYRSMLREFIGRFWEALCLNATLAHQRPDSVVPHREPVMPEKPF
jgi:hypothetical protein